MMLTDNVFFLGPNLEDRSLYLPREFGKDIAALNHVQLGLSIIICFDGKRKHIAVMLHVGKDL